MYNTRDKITTAMDGLVQRCQDGKELPTAMDGLVQRCQGWPIIESAVMTQERCGFRAGVAPGNLTGNYRMYLSIKENLIY